MHAFFCFSKRASLTGVTSALALVVVTLAACTHDARDITSPAVSQVAAAVDTITPRVVITTGQPWGRIVDSYRGEAIHVNSGIGKPTAKLQPSGEYGLQWECTELVRRVMARLFGVARSDLPNGNAKDFWSWNPRFPSVWRRVANGGIEMPSEGDVCVMAGGADGLGHVCVLAEPRFSSVVAVQQNTQNTRQPLFVTMSFVAGTPRYTVSALTNYSTLGWWTRSPLPVITPSISHVSPATVRRSNVAQTLTLSLSGVGDDVMLTLIDPFGHRVIFRLANIVRTASGITLLATLSTAGTWRVNATSNGRTSNAVAITVTR